MTKFFVDPFAVSGTKTPIPDLIQLDGSVSYTEGFGFDYERDQATDPLAKDIPRDQTNQLFFDITGAIQQYQTHGVPDFITSVANGGTPYSYDKYARVLYDDGTNGVRPYESLISSNTSLPTDNTKWKLLVNLGSAVIIPDAVFNTGVADGNVVYWDNANSRFDKAIANGGAAQQAVGIADVTNEQVYLSGNVNIFTGLIGGDVYYLSSTIAGSLTNTQPTNNIVRIGVANSATDILLNIIIFPAITAIKRRVFTTSVSYTPSAGLVYADVEVQAPGGGGGGGGSGGGAGAGGGGGAGGYGRKIFDAITIGASQTITINSPGNGGNGNNPGTIGGTASFGALLSATGGEGGLGGPSVTQGVQPGGAGGSATGGDINAGGASGQNGVVTSPTDNASGAGGPAIYGGPGQSQSNGTAPVGTGFGAGGTAGASKGGVNNSGAIGQPGVVIVNEYIS